MRIDNEFDLMGLRHEEAETLVGSHLPNLLKGYKAVGESIVISLDEYFADLFGTKYTIARIYSLKQQPSNKTYLRVYVSGIDDINFGTWINPRESIHLFSLIADVEEWFKRSNYRFINLHALDDYLNYITDSDGYEVDWN